MHVYAVCTTPNKGWRWRIMNYAGEVLEESRDTFATIATAVAHGSARLSKMKLVDRSVRPSTHQLRLSRRANGQQRSA